MSSRLLACVVPWARSRCDQCTDWPWAAKAQPKAKHAETNRKAQVILSKISLAWHLLMPMWVDGKAKVTSQPTVGSMVWKTACTSSSPSNFSIRLSSSSVCAESNTLVVVGTRSNPLSTIS